MLEVVTTSVWWNRQWSPSLLITANYRLSNVDQSVYLYTFFGHPPYLSSFLYLTSLVLSYIPIYGTAQELGDPNYFKRWVGWKKRKKRESEGMQAICGPSDQ